MMSSRASPRLILATACAAFILSACGTSPEAQLRNAEKALRAGDYGAVLVETRNVLAKDKSNGKAQLLMVRALLQYGDLDSAAKQLDAAKDLNLPAADVAEIRARIALGHGKAKDLLAAIDGGTSGLDGAAKDRFRAMSLQALRRVPEALALYTKLLAESTKDDELHVLAGECQLFLGRPRLAMEQADLAIAARPDSAKGWLMKASLLSAEGKADESRAALDKAAACAPGLLSLPERATLLGTLVESSLSRRDVGAASKAQADLVKTAPQAPFTQLADLRIQLARGEVVEPVSALQTLMQKSGSYTAGRATLVAALLLKGSYELALHEFGALKGASPDEPRFKVIEAAIKAADKEQPGSPGRALALANALGALNHGYLALPLIEAALKQTPDSLPLAVAQVRLLLAAGDATAALAKAEALAASGSKDPQVLSSLVDAQVARGQWAQAAATTEKLWAAKPVAQLAIGLSQLRLRGQLAQPAEPLQRWLAKHPGDIEVRTRLAMLNESLGQRAEAIAEYERAATDAPRNYIALNNLAVLYRDKGDPRALATARKAFELAPRQAAVADTYGWMLVQGREATKALPLLKAASDTMPGNAEVRYHYAAALAATGNRAEATLQIVEALRDPTPTPWRAEARKLAETLSAP
ncbi:MAG: hypothetical protein RLZZ200_278 [Pseudomonadota bacterium]|jgi:tetratricopeptide (TPR) repeat protein